MSKSTTHQIAAAVIGNALEWYDFIVFGFMTAVISAVFFPAENAYASLLLTTASFGIGFVLRPVGGILIGAYADRRGRRAALQLIILLMTVATAMIAFAPPYAAIGVASSVMIIVARMLQGLATGGEFASATAFLVEMAPPHRRGLYGSWQMFGQGLAMLLGAGVAALITGLLPRESLHAWGWRVPFLVGLLIAPVGIWIRHHLSETADIGETAGGEPGEGVGSVGNVVGQTLMQHRRGLLASFLLTTSATISFYVLVIYLPTYANKTLGIALESAFIAQCIGIAVMIATIPLCGALSDRIGRQTVLRTALILSVLLMYPCFQWLIASPGFARFMWMQILLCGIFGAFLGPFSSAVAEQFPQRIRSTGMAVSYNVAVMIFGGFAQFILTWLLHVTGSPMTPAFYLLFGACAGLIGSLAMARKDKALPFSYAGNPPAAHAEPSRQS
ncbi:MFS transporter [Cupriavidus plantarum]|uniref:Putative MFS family arabinose efflux permease n=1 Tax=Cupriavidus plantarum TaxID=942865 RepID=A0A316EQL0_9BURK|nr:MFS transporter [Cupriavidus plantarum]PWK34754.1 putative MFS family arabinose efflux permease [Cupriavidus plantarum]